MGLLLDIMGLSETGWKVNTTNKFLMKAAVGISVGGGRLDASFKTGSGRMVGVSGTAIGLGVGAGGSFELGRELTRAVIKYASALKFLSGKSDLYRYAITNREEPTPEGLAQCDLVLTTLGSNAGLFGASVDYFAFYKKGEPNTPRWIWFAAGAEVSGGGSGALMQFKTDGVRVTQ